jgi:hypothetical protein
MKRYRLLVALCLALCGLGVWPAYTAYVSASKHELARKRFNDELGPPFAIKPIDDDAIRDIERDWVCRYRDAQLFAEALAMVDRKPSLRDLIDFMNYRIPPTSLLDGDANKRNAVIAKVQSTVMPLSTDRTIHESKAQRKCVIYPGDGMAFVFTERDGGLEEALFVRKKDIEPSDGAESR